MSKTQHPNFAYADDPAQTSLYLSPSFRDRPSNNTGRFAGNQSSPTRSQYDTLISRDYAGGSDDAESVLLPPRWEDRGSGTTSQIPQRSKGMKPYNHRQLNGDQPSPSNTRSGLPRARHRSLPIHVPESNVVMNSNENFAGRHSILFEGTQPAFYIGAGPMLVPYRYPPHQYYEEGQTYYIPMSGPSTSPPAGPSQVRGHGVSSPGYYGTYHPAGSMTRNWVPIGNPIDPQADLTGPSGHANPRPAYAEPAYIEYAGASRSSYRAMTTGATSHGSMSEGSVVVYGMNNNSSTGPNPAPLQIQMLAPNGPFPWDNGDTGNQTVDHDENRKPCKGHGFRHWLRTHFGRHKCRKNLKDVLVITPYIS